MSNNFIEYFNSLPEDMQDSIIALAYAAGHYEFGDSKNDHMLLNDRMIPHNTFFSTQLAKNTTPIETVRQNIINSTDNINKLCSVYSELQLLIHSERTRLYNNLCKLTHDSDTEQLHVNCTSVHNTYCLSTKSRNKSKSYSDSFDTSYIIQLIQRIIGKTQHFKLVDSAMYVGSNKFEFSFIVPEIFGRFDLTIPTSGYVSTRDINGYYGRYSKNSSYIGQLSICYNCAGIDLNITGWTIEELANKWAAIDPINKILADAVKLCVPPKSSAEVDLSAKVFSKFVNNSHVVAVKVLTANKWKGVHLSLIGENANMIDYDRTECFNKVKTLFEAEYKKHNIDPAAEYMYMN